MLKPKWIFKSQSIGDTDNNAVGSQFFNLQSLKDQALARESGQNSLDSNRSYNKKLLLKLKLVEESTETIANNQFIKSIHKHSSHKKSGLSNRAPDKHKKFRYLVIEDFNTNGVRGDLKFTNDGDDSSNNSHQDLYHLFRSLQVTGKGSGESNNKQLGSWGMGKNMYAQTSDLGCFLGYSIRDHEQAEFLFGMSILQLHTLEGVKYKPTGNFGFGDSNPDNLTMPIVDNNIITDFKTRFKIERKDEKGLSIVIPCIYNKVTYEMLVRTFLETWMYAILSERMEIHIECGNESAKLDNASIINYIHFFSDKHRENVERKIRYAMQTVRAKKNDFIKLKLNENLRSPAWSKEHFKTQSLESWQNKLEENDKVFFKVPVNIVYSDSSKDKVGYFDVFIFKDSEIITGNDVQFIRDILIIPGINPRIRLLKGYHAIIRVTGDLADILRESEGPAHMEWSKDLPKFEALELMYGGQLISYVCHSAANLKKFMVSVSRSTYDDVLAELLPYLSGDGSRKKAKKKKKKTDPNPPDPPKPSLPAICKDSEISGGFKLSDNEEWDDDDMIDMEYKIKIAFDLGEGGSPFNNYKDWQFQIADMPASTQKIKNIRIDKNVIRFNVNARGWHYQLSGFPEEYQLILNVTRS